jgi:hypothetical protein
MKLKKGHIREDGMVFWSYTKRNKSGERWVSKDQFEKYQDHYRKYDLIRYQKNKENFIKVSREWRENNKEKLKQACAKWRIENKERLKQKSAEYNKKNNHLRRANQAKRRAFKKSSAIMLTKPQKKIIDAFYEQAHRLEKRLGIKFHVDHIIPLARGGMHSPANLQVLPGKINIIKNCHRVFRWSELNEA